jgi:hypothetical protein
MSIGAVVVPVMGGWSRQGRARVLQRDGGTHIASQSGRGASEWSRHWTSVVQCFSLEASLNQSMSEQ